MGTNTDEKPHQVEVKNSPATRIPAQVSSNGNEGDGNVTVLTPSRLNGEDANGKVALSLYHPDEGEFGATVVDREELQAALKTEQSRIED